VFDLVRGHSDFEPVLVKRSNFWNFRSIFGIFYVMKITYTEIRFNLRPLSLAKASRP
jgi:hypothetical protein